MDNLHLHCAVPLLQDNTLFSAFFLAGLMGGFTHCLQMCGPIVASQASTCNSGCGTKVCSRRDQLTQATQVTYHVGRAVTYGALGFFAALLSNQLQNLSFWPWLSAAMLVAAGAMFIASSLPGCKHSLFTSQPKLTFTRSLLLGFMPCGLLYAALMLAASTANPLKAMLSMWVFTLGTIPALLVASIGTTVLEQKWRSVMQKAGRVMLVFNGLSLLVMAGKLIRI